MKESIKKYLFVLTGFLYFSLAHFLSKYVINNPSYWNSEFWGWESGTLININSGDFYDSNIIVYPYLDTLLIKLTSELLNFTFFRAELFLILFCGFLILHSTYLLFRFYSVKHWQSFTIGISLSILIFFIVSDILYNVLTLPISIYALYYFCKFCKTSKLSNLIYLSILIFLLLNVKQNVGLGFFSATFFGLAYNSYINKKTQMVFFKNISIIILINLGLFPIFTFLNSINLLNYLETLFLSSLNLKGGLIGFIIKFYETFFRIEIDIELIFLVFIYFFINTKKKYISKLLDSIIIFVLLFLALFSFFGLFEGRETLNLLFESLGNINPKISIYYEFFYFCYVASLVTLAISKNENRNELMTLFVMGHIVSLFAHLSSNMSTVLTYPVVLHVVLILILIQNAKKVNFNYLIILFFLLPSVFLISKKYNDTFSNGNISINHSFTHDLVFPDNIYYNNISKISDIVKNNNLLIVPDSTTIQSLIGSPKPQDFKVKNHFVDMFPSQYLESEIDVYQTVCVDYVLLVVEEHWIDWYNKHSHENSAAEKFNNFVIKDVKSSNFKIVDKFQITDQEDSVLYSSTNC